MNSMLKAFMVSALSLSALVGCGEDDGGKLAGTYINTVVYATGSKGEKKIILEYKKPNYDVSYQLNQNNPQSVGVVKKDGDYLVMSDSSAKKMFEIQKNGGSLISLNDPSKTIFKKEGN